MSKYLTDMKPGDTIEMKGPIKKYDYHANKKAEIGMIAGGTGIAPMWQVIIVGCNILACASFNCHYAGNS